MVRKPAATALLCNGTSSVRSETLWVHQTGRIYKLDSQHEMFYLKVFLSSPSPMMCCHSSKTFFFVIAFLCRRLLLRRFFTLPCESILGSLSVFFLTQLRPHFKEGLKLIELWQIPDTGQDTVAISYPSFLIWETDDLKPEADGRRAAGDMEVIWKPQWKQSPEKPMSMFVTLHGSETRPLSKSRRARLDGFNSGAPRTVQQANQGTQERLISALWFGHLLPLDRPTRCCWMEATDGFNRRWRGSWSCSTVTQDCLTWKPLVSRANVLLQQL